MTAFSLFLPPPPPNPPCLEGGGGGRSRGPPLGMWRPLAPLLSRIPDIPVELLHKWVQHRRHPASTDAVGASKLLAPASTDAVYVLDSQLAPASIDAVGAS